MIFNINDFFLLCSFDKIDIELVEQVSAPQEAAIKIWEAERFKGTIEAGRYAWELYEIDFKAKEVKKGSIPTLNFS